MKHKLTAFLLLTSNLVVNFSYASTSTTATSASTPAASTSSSSSSAPSTLPSSIPAVATNVPGDTYLSNVMAALANTTHLEIIPAFLIAQSVSPSPQGANQAIICNQRATSTTGTTFYKFDSSSPNASGLVTNQSELAALLPLFALPKGAKFQLNIFSGPNGTGNVTSYIGQIVLIHGDGTVLGDSICYARYLENDPVLTQASGTSTTPPAVTPPASSTTVSTTSSTATANTTPPVSPTGPVATAVSTAASNAAGSGNTPPATVTPPTSSTTVSTTTPPAAPTGPVATAVSTAASNAAGSGNTPPSSTPPASTTTTSSSTTSSSTTTGT